MLLTAATEALNTGTPGLRGDSSPSPPDRFTVPSTSHQKERIRQHRFARKVQRNTEVILEVRIARRKIVLQSTWMGLNVLKDLVTELLIYYLFAK